MQCDKQMKVADKPAIVYFEFVKRLVKRFPRAVALTTTEGNIPTNQLSAAHDELVKKVEGCHAAIGIATEACEVADVLKAHFIYGKEFDRKALVKELGDVNFWITELQNMFNISDHEIIQQNVDKLSERYSKMHYSDVQAIARVDKKFYIAVNAVQASKGIYTAGPFEHRYEAERLAQFTDLIVDEATGDVYEYYSMGMTWRILLNNGARN